MKYSHNLASKIRKPIINSLCQAKYIMPQVMRQALEGSSLGSQSAGSYLYISDYNLTNAGMQGVYL